VILIISNTQDMTADFVVQALVDRGVEFARLNTDEFPQRGAASVWFGAGGDSDGVIEWTNHPNTLRLASVRAVWYRRPVPPVVDPEITDEGSRKFATDECYEFLRGLWHNLNCYWMSPPEAIRKAEHKIVQLRAAVNCGFLIPKTVVTNCPVQVSNLKAKCTDGIVAKPLYLGFVKGSTEGAYLYTTRLRPEHIADHEAIQLAPSIYQEFVPKCADVRVTVVEDTVFAARIVANDLPTDIPDWRYALTNLEHSAYVLPADESMRCRRLVRELGLKFGEIDYAFTNDGRHFFLEINPNGQWAWLESAIGSPIGAAIANCLIAGNATP
jgi:glutathione synthase/RimK-type ligase-like ATP-grasp enzyme